MIDDMDRLKVRLREAEAGVDDHEITVLVTGDGAGSGCRCTLFALHLALGVFLMNSSVVKRACCESEMQ